MSYHHELFKDLPQGIESWPGHCKRKFLQSYFFTQNQSSLIPTIDKEGDGIRFIVDLENVKKNS